MKDLKNVLKEIALTKGNSPIFLGSDFDEIVKDSFSILWDYGIYGGGIINKLNTTELTSYSKEKLEDFKNSISPKLNRSVIIQNVKPIGQSMFGFKITFKDMNDIEQYANVIAGEIKLLK